MYSKRTQTTEEGDSKSIKISDGQSCSRAREPGQLLGSCRAERTSLSQRADSCFSQHPSENRAYLQFLLIFAAGSGCDKGAALNMQEAPDKGPISQTCPLLCREANSPAREPSAKQQNYLASVQNPYSTQVTDSMAGKANGAINTNVAQ